MDEVSIKTERLLLRRWKDSDLPSLVALNQDPKVMEFIGPILDEAESRAMIRRADKSWAENGYGRFAVEVLNTLEPIGFIGLAQCKFESHFTPAVEIGWRLAHDHWNLGYATEAGKAVIEWAFKNCDLQELVAFTAASNQRSCRVMEKIGMKRDTADDFLHPNMEADNPLRENVLYRRRNTP